MKENIQKQEGETYTDHKFTLQDLMDIEPDNRGSFSKFVNIPPQNLDIVRNSSTNKIQTVKIYNMNEENERINTFYGNIAELTKAHNEGRLTYFKF